MHFVFLQALHALCISAAHPAVTLRVAVTEIDEKPRGELQQGGLRNTAQTRARDPCS